MEKDNMTPRSDRLQESMEILSSDESKLSQKLDPMVSMMHAQPNRDLNSALNDRVIPEIQKIASNLSLRGKERKWKRVQGRSDMPDGPISIEQKRILDLPLIKEMR